MAEKIEPQNIQNTSVVPRIPNNDTIDHKNGISLVSENKATPVFAIESSLENEDVFETAQPYDNDQTMRATMRTVSPRPPETSDNISVANSEVILRRPPPLGRYLSTGGEPPRNRLPNIKHSHSTSDLYKYQHPYSRSNLKDQRSMIQPIAPHSQTRSPLVNSQSYDGLHFMASQFNNSNPNLTSPSTPQERFAPYKLGDGGGYPNESYQNRGSNYGGSNYGGYNNGGFIVSNGDFDHYKDNRLTPQTNSSLDHHLPTSPEAKKKMFTDILSVSTSTIYAILILTLGISFYVVDFLEIEENRIIALAEGFSLTLISLALLYLIYLIIDISIYTHKKVKFEKLMEHFTEENMEMQETNEGIVCDVTLDKAMALKKQLDHRYCFNMDRHSSNFYLKVGAAGFCFGHLIHSFLVLTFRGILNSTDIDDTDCFNTVSFIIEIAYPLYSIILLFFIFKYSNVIINKHRDFHRFGFMHCLAASLCFWVWTIFRETAEYLQYQKTRYKYDNDSTISENVLLNENRTGVQLLASITPRRFTKMCEYDTLNVIYQNYSPYLYPFSVEYSILVVGILYIVWINIGLCASSNLENENHHGEDTRACKNHKSYEQESNVNIHADCHAANKGLFAGFIILVFAIVSVILFFITFYNSTDLAITGHTHNTVTSIAIMFCMILAVIFAYTQIIKLDVNEAAHNSLDNFLCLMCLPAFFVNGIFSIIPAIIYGETLQVLNITFGIIQILIQTPFIIDGMARSSNTKELRKQKPGREFVTFLVICNVAMWIMQTFEVKSHGLNSYRQDFYSKELWSIVGHLCLPLMMFYRFHCSVCIGDIWKYAYMPSGH